MVHSIYHSSSLSGLRTCLACFLALLLFFLSEFIHHIMGGCVGLSTSAVHVAQFSVVSCIVFAMFSFLSLHSFYNATSSSVWVFVLICGLPPDLLSVAFLQPEKEVHMMYDAQIQRVQEPQGWPTACTVLERLKGRVDYRGKPIIPPRNPGKKMVGAARLRTNAPVYSRPFYADRFQW